MRVFHVKHSGECAPAPLRRDASSALAALSRAPLRRPRPEFRPSRWRRASPCALLRASPGPVLSRDLLCSAGLLAANVSRETSAPLPHPPAPHPPVPRRRRPAPSLPFSCGLLRFPGLLATMFHVKHSSAFALASISGSAFAHRPPRLSCVFVAALSRPSGARPSACLPLPLARPSLTSHLPAPRFPELRPAPPRPAPVLSPSFLTLS